MGDRQLDRLPWSVKPLVRLALIVVGVVGLTPLGFIAFLATGQWILVVSIMLLVRGEPSTT